MGPASGIGRDAGPSGRRVLNPLRSEQEAFRFLLWVVAVVAAIVLVVVVARAIF